MRVRFDSRSNRPAPLFPRLTPLRLSAYCSVFQSNFFAIVATLLPLVAQAQSLPGGTINVLTATNTVNVPISVPAVATIVNVPINLLGNSINVPVSVLGAANTINVLTNSITVPINVLGNTINLPVNVLGNSINVPGASTTINVPISINVSTAELASAINTLGAIPAMRRNDTLLGLDLGVDRQIDLLTSAGSDWDADRNGWSALGGSRLAGMILDSWGGSSRLSPGRIQTNDEIDRFSFATSMQQARQGTAAGPRDAADEAPPYALGATSRSPPPSRTAFDVWAEGSFSWFNDGSDQSQRHGHWAVLYLGADYRLSPNVLIGTLVQFDQASHQFDGLPIGGSDSGWMAGPYATVRLSNNLFFQARTAWGKSDVTLGLDRSHENHFDTERWLVRGTLLGQWQWGPWQFRPRASVGYIEEDQESYVSSLGATIPSQTVSLGQAKLGPEVVYRYRMPNGMVIEPSLLLEGIWNFKQDASSLSVDELAVGDKIRGRAETGLMVRTPSGITFGATVSYDGIGSDDYQAIGGKMRVRVPFN